MANYRIHIDPSPPDPAVVERNQDFEALYRDYQAQRRFEFWRNLYRKPRNFVVLIMLVSVGSLVFWADEEVPPRAYALHSAPGTAAPAWQVAERDPANSTELALRQGVSLEIPAQAWADSSGPVVAGPIQLHYRLIEGPADAFAAGVPRPWDSTEALTGLRLLEVYATQGARRLTLRQGHPIKVSWALAERHPQLRVSRLDTGAARWQPIEGCQWQPKAAAKAAPPVPPPPPEVRDEVADTLIAKSARRPTPPPRPFGNRPRNIDDFPQLRGLEKVYWAHLPQPGSSDPWASGLIDAERPWNDIRIRALAADRYELRFARVSPEGGMEVRRVIARPLLQADSDAEAWAWYQEQKAQYRAQMAAMARADSLRIEWARKQQAYEQALAQWQARPAETDVDTTTAGTLSYALAYTGVSGLWVALPAPSAVRTVSPQAEAGPVARAWQPWYYAVQGDTLWPVWVEEKQLRVAAPADAALSWRLARPQTEAYPEE